MSLANRNMTKAPVNIPIKAPAKTATDPGAIQLVKGIIGLIDEMVQIMDKEVLLLGERKMKDHAELLKRKQRLAIDYRASLKTIALQPNYLDHVPEELRQAARMAGHKLAAASERNAQVLRAAMVAVERLAKSIIMIVKDEVLPKGGYTNLHAGPATLGYSPKCTPVTGSRTA